VLAVRYHPAYDQLVISGGSDCVVKLWNISSISSQGGVNTLMMSAVGNEQPSTSNRSVEREHEINEKSNAYHQPCRMTIILCTPTRSMKRAFGQSPGAPRALGCLHLCRTMGEWLRISCHRTKPIRLCSMRRSQDSLR
jgi:hypothetical protein